MKIARAKIENFRKIESLELDFTNSLDEVREVSILAGPNTSGKTTILDALAACLGLCTELPSYGRPDFEITPRLVRQHALNTRVTCQVRFAPEEIESIREVFRLYLNQSDLIPSTEEVTVTWTYPDPNWDFTHGILSYEPENSRHLFKGRGILARLITPRLVDWSWFQRVGGVFTFDQQRTGLGRTIPRDLWNIINGTATNGSKEDENRRTSDPRSILLSLSIQSRTDPAPGVTKIDQFTPIKEAYDRICAPHKLIGHVLKGQNEFDLSFSDGVNEYFYDELSSGEEMLLLFLIRMVSEYVHRSVVFVDELELHQHPIWQRKLLHLLPKIGFDNQIIATTHSQYLREVAPPGSVIDLGNLLDH